MRAVGRLAAAVTLAVAVATPPARGDFETYTFSGVITTVADEAGHPGLATIHLLDGLVNPGDAFNGTLTIDLDQTLDAGVYAPISFALKVETPHWSYNNGGQGALGSLYDAVNLAFATPDRVWVPGLSLLGDPFASFFLVNGSLLDITGSTHSQAYGDPDFEVRGRVSAIRAVPEPASLALLVAGGLLAITSAVKGGRRSRMRLDTGGI